jgi:hypothetical protein
MTARPILVFAGPSLPTAMRPADPAFEWRPPAAAGDLLHLLADPPATLCLTDGYFDARPSVWHKEILLLIEAGWSVLGAASMGALRAAELDRLGMIGVGAIYRAYRDGRLHGDDEVALVHALGEHGWRPVSEPLVDVRATLVAAVRARVLSASTARHLRAVARSIHFSDRDWPGILAHAGWPAHAVSVFREWLRTGAVRLKQNDALACLARAKEATHVAHTGERTPITCFLRDLARECEVALPR